jgi:diguanylate cyclase (GGDEF)-like protein
VAPELAPQTVGAVDPRKLAGRRAGLLFLVSGLLAFLGILLSQVEPGRRLLIAGLGLLDLVLAAAFTLLPWHRLAPRMLLAIPVFGYVTIGLFDVAGAFPTPYLYPIFFILLSVWLGLSQPPRTAIWLAPVTTAAYVLPLLQPGHDGRALSSVITAVVTFVLVSEVIARAVHQLETARAQSHHRAELLGNVVRATRMLSTLDPGALMSSLVDAVIAMGFDAAAFNVFDEEGKTFRVVRARNLPDHVVEGIHPAQQGVAGMVLASGRAQLIENYRDDPRANPELAREGFQVVAGAPIIIDRRIAAVMVASARRPIQLTAQDLEALELLGQQAAAELANVIRFEMQGREKQFLAEAAVRDHLTGLGNRQFVSQILADLQPDDGVLLADLDHFKSVNDSDGHAGGDAVLVALATFLKRTLRVQDLAGRYGGEEFMIVLPQTGVASGDAARRLVAAWQATSPRTTISIGAAIHRRDRSAHATVEAADAALYVAKRDGRNCARLEPPRRDTLPTSNRPDEPHAPRPA